MNANQILEKLKNKFPDAILDAKIDGVLEPFAKIKTEMIKEVCQFMHDDEELNFDYLMCLSGIDYGKGLLGVVYNLSSIKHKHKFTLKVEVTAETPDLPSVESIWKTANWHEREAYDMFGINFDGHPDLRRILLPDDWEGHPLKKDYQVQEFYHGMKVPY